MELLSITDRLWLVPAQNKGRFPYAQSIYVDAERKLLFDTGMGPKVLRSFAEQHQVDIVIVSHAHPDHIAGCSAFEGTAPIYIPAQSDGTFGDLDELASRFIEGEAETSLWKSLVRKYMGFENCVASHTYDGRTAFDLGSVKLLAMHTPGHTVDHYCFFEEHSGVLLLFDIDLSPFGPWYGNRESDVDSYEASLSLVQSYSPEIVVSSHMGVLRSNVGEALETFAARIPQRDEIVVKMVERPMSLDEIASYFPFTPEFHPRLQPLFLYWEKQMVKKHLDRMIGRGEITPQGDKYVQTR